MKRIYKEKPVSAITFKAPLHKIGESLVIILPKEVSQKLPSRGMTMVEGTVNDALFQSPVEPDGRGGHWFKFTDTMQKNTGAKIGDTLTFSVSPMSTWSNPQIPKDLQSALEIDQEANSLWKKITPNARWDWIRWVNFTKDINTRKRRISVACSKLKAGEKRPCCFNRNMCSDTSVSKNGLLLA